MSRSSSLPETNKSKIVAVLKHSGASVEDALKELKYEAADFDKALAEVKLDRERFKQVKTIRDCVVKGIAAFGSICKTEPHQSKFLDFVKRINIDSIPVFATPNELASSPTKPIRFTENVVKEVEERFGMMNLTASFELVDRINKKPSDFLLEHCCVAFLQIIYQRGIANKPERFPNIAACKEIPEHKPLHDAFAALPRHIGVLRKPNRNLSVIITGKSTEYIPARRTSMLDPFSTQNRTREQPLLAPTIQEAKTITATGTTSHVLAVLPPAATAPTPAPAKEPERHHSPSPTPPPPPPPQSDPAGEETATPPPTVNIAASGPINFTI